MLQQILANGQVVTLIHLALLDETGRYYIACMPGVRELHATPQHPAFQRSGELGAVTCPMCKKHGGGL